MPQGIIKKLTDRRFGFIATDTGDVFFHMSVLSGVRFDQLHEGDAVEFDAVPDPRGQRAESVRLA